MIEIDLDGQKVSVVEGSMVMHAADKAGTYIPHFCYHKKLTIAANCRMCLVDVEKAPKPMPACATPVTQGMIVRTKSDKALKAQQGVMEFLLINHPLDCPICDQGGECQLQDLAVGYGASKSRYTEEKRVVYPKDFGPLISAREMNRCIQCTRCVRFGQEIGGVMELGMIHRGEHSEITTVAGDTVDSELSGNMIDVCPVGALTSKPFRYSARTWELSRRKSVSPHDSTGANLIVQVKNATVMRVVPLENEDVNECWLADRDRFSYEALNGGERLTTPMVRQNGEWQAIDWTSALEYVARSLKQISSEHGAASIGALASTVSTVEELHLLGKVVRGLGSDNIDHRLRQSDFSADGSAPSNAPRTARWLGTPIAALSSLHRVLVVGSFLRKDHPLFAQRIRQSARKGGKVHSLHALDDDWLMPMAKSLVVAPSAWVGALAGVAAAIAEAQTVAAPLEADITDDARAIAKSLATGERKAVLFGQAAMSHPRANELAALGRWIAEKTGATFGFLGAGGNAVGAQLVGAMPLTGGLNAAQMLGGTRDAKPLKACVLLQVEPELDAADAAAARTAMSQTAFVVSLTSFKPTGSSDELADVLLPIAPFTETSGTFVNAEGRAQSFHGVVKPLGDARPAWKVLRVLGNLLGLPDFAFDTSEEVRAEALGDLSSIPERLSNAGSVIVSPSAPKTVASDIERIADVPLYATDPIVRRAPSLQLTADARQPVVGVPRALAQQLGLAFASNVDRNASNAGIDHSIAVEAGAWVSVTQSGATVVLEAKLDASLPENVVRVAAGHPSTAALGAMFGTLTVAKADRPLVADDHSALDDDRIGGPAWRVQQSDNHQARAV